MTQMMRPRIFFRLLRSDSMNISRDPMQIFALAMAVAPAVAFAMGHGALDAAARAAIGLDGASSFAAPVVLVLPAVLIGWVTGFLLLEDRDDGVLGAVGVTPIGRAGFLTYRVTITALLGAAITAGAIPFVAPNIALWQGSLIVFAVAAEAVLAAILLPALARNKVEGLALTKLSNLAAVVPLLAFVPSWFRYMAGIIPTYWLGELVSGQSPLPAWGLALATVATHAGAGALLMGLFQRRID